MQLHGHWRLQRCTLSFSDGRPTRHPFEDGFLCYSPQGTMQACLSTKERSVFSKSSLERGYQASQAEKAQCFDEYLSYAGSYEIVNQQVIHHVDVSLNPSIIGQTLQRSYRFEDDMLVLFYDVSLPNELCCHYSLIWKRAHVSLS